MKFFTKIVLIVLFLGATLFSKDIATVTGLSGKAFLERNAKKTRISLGNKLQEQDTIITKDKSKVQIVFEDETVVTVGKNSSFSIKEYLFEEGQEPVARFGMLRGAMRTITGKIGKIAPNKFSVVTKTSTIGIRGTNFSVMVGKKDSLIVYCTYGAISVTINEVKYIVKEDFYMIISPDGKVEIKELTSKELNKLQKDNFGESSERKGVVNRATGLRTQGLLDKTRDNKSVIVIKDIREKTRDAISVAVNDEVSRIATQEEAARIAEEEAARIADEEAARIAEEEAARIAEEEAARIAEEEAARIAEEEAARIAEEEAARIAEEEAARIAAEEEAAARLANPIVMNGWMVDNKTNHYSREVSLKILESPAEFVTADSWLKDGIRNGYGGLDEWQLFIASTPSSYTSREQFSATFSGVTMTSSESSNPRITTGSFIATGDDLLNGDYMSWGSWNATLLYDHSMMGVDQVHNMTGLWVTGEVTSATVVSTLTGTVTYPGIYKAMSIASGGITNGVAGMVIDFGANDVSLTIVDYSGTSDAVYTMSISGNTITGTQNGEIGAADGTFYGPAGDSVGGNFSITKTPTTTSGFPVMVAKGVYQVTKP